MVVIIQWIDNSSSRIQKTSLIVQVSQKNVSETGALCPTFDKPEQGLDLLHEAITAANLTPGEDIHIAINAASHEYFDFVSNFSNYVRCFVDIQFDSSDFVDCRCHINLCNCIVYINK